MNKLPGSVSISFGGATWTAVSNGLTDVMIGPILTDDSDPVHLWAGSIDGGGVFETTDGGRSWTPAPGGGLMGKVMECLPAAGPPAAARRAIPNFKGSREHWKTGPEAYSKIAYEDLLLGTDLDNVTINRIS